MDTPRLKQKYLKTFKPELMKELGITTYCFSLDWSRIEPEQGYFDEAELYKDIHIFSIFLYINSGKVKLPIKLTH